VGEGLIICNNRALTSLEGLSSLTTVGFLGIYENESLCQSIVDGFVDGITLTGSGSSHTCCTNDDSC
jgi:hypothetical protein